MEIPIIHNKVFVFCLECVWSTGRKTCMECVWGPGGGGGGIRFRKCPQKFFNLSLSCVKIGIVKVIIFERAYTKIFSSVFSTFFVRFWRGKNQCMRFRQHFYCVILAFLKISSGKAILFLCEYMESHLRVYRDTFRHFESKERLGKVRTASRSAPFAVLLIACVVVRSPTDLPVIAGNVVVLHTFRKIICNWYLAPF
jgi:hypothetical protein